MSKSNHYQLIAPKTATGFPIRAWIRGVPLEEKAKAQLQDVAQLPFLFKWLAAMPDVHFGIGATIGSVIATQKKIIPAAVRLDIGCGMMAIQTTLKAFDLPDNLRSLRNATETAVPVGRTNSGGRNDKGAWENSPPKASSACLRFQSRYQSIIDKHPKARTNNGIKQLSTLGSGNH